MSYTQSMLEVSVIIPAYNEEHRLPTTLESVHNFFSEEAIAFEIIVVNDGSTDATTRVVEEFGKHHENVRLIGYPVNRGKGYAVRTGVLSANGRYILIDDADGSSPIEEYLRLRASIDSGADIVIGSRARPDQTRIVRALAYRTHMGNTFNRLVQSLLLPGIQDTQCGFKLFKNHVGQEIFSRAKVDGFAYDVEVLFIAKMTGCKTNEIAINWHNVAGSKINIVSDSWKMLLEVFYIFANSLLGRYKSRTEVEIETVEPK